MEFHLADYFILVSILQGIFIGLAILLSSRYRKGGNGYLAVAIILLSFITFIGWQDFGYFWIDYLWYHMWEYLVPIPIFFFALRVLNHPYQKASWLPWLYLPFVISFAGGISFDLSHVFGWYEHPLGPDSPGHLLYKDIEDSLALYYNIFLIGWIFLLSRKKEKLTAREKHWLRQFIIAMLLVLLVWFLNINVDENYHAVQPGIAVWLALSLLFWWIGYTGVYQQKLLVKQPGITKGLEVEVTSHTTLTTKVDEYVEQLDKLMQNEEIYRDDDLGRKVVAEKLGISEGYLSQIVNEKKGRSFVDYISTYRISAAREMLSNPNFDPYSLAAIGREAGFKSRSAFYSAFKKATGKTPGGFRKARKGPN